MQAVNRKLTIQFIRPKLATLVRGVWVYSDDPTSVDNAMYRIGIHGSSIDLQPAADQNNVV